MDAGETPLPSVCWACCGGSGNYLWCDRLLMKRTRHLSNGQRGYTRLAALQLDVAADEWNDFISTRQWISASGDGRFLSILATSVQSERLFFATGRFSWNFESGSYGSKSSLDWVLGLADQDSRMRFPGVNIPYLPHLYWALFWGWSHWNFA